MKYGVALYMHAVLALPKRKHILNLTKKPTTAVCRADVVVYHRCEYLQQTYNHVPLTPHMQPLFRHDPRREVHSIQLYHPSPIIFRNLRGDFHILFERFDGVRSDNTPATNALLTPPIAAHPPHLPSAITLLQLF